MGKSRTLFLVHGYSLGVISAISALAVHMPGSDRIANALKVSAANPRGRSRLFPWRDGMLGKTTGMNKVENSSGAHTSLTTAREGETAPEADERGGTKL